FAWCCRSFHCSSFCSGRGESEDRGGLHQGWRGVGRQDQKVWSQDVASSPFILDREPQPISLGLLVFSDHHVLNRPITSPKRHASHIAINSTSAPSLSARSSVS